MAATRDYNLSFDIDAFCHNHKLNLANGLDESPTVMVIETKQKATLIKNRGKLKPSWGFVENKIK